MYVCMYVGAPHTMDVVCAPEWNRSYSRETAAFPAPWCNPALPSGTYIHTYIHTYIRTYNHHIYRQISTYHVCMYVGRKFWPTVGRIDNVYGDRNLVCTCPPMSVYETEPAAA